VFTVSQEGSVTIAGEKQTTRKGGTSTPDTTFPSVPRPDHVTQVTLFSTEELRKQLQTNQKVSLNFV